MAVPQHQLCDTEILANSSTPCKPVMKPNPAGEPHCPFVDGPRGRMPLSMHNNAVS